jgi:aminoglycoside phosphotransferase (APT) family kinase protein
MTGDSEGAVVTDEAVRGMVGVVSPDWTVSAIERVGYGTDFVARLTVETDTQRQRVVLKATTADHAASAAARGEPRILELVADRTDIPVPTVYGYCDDHPSYPSPFFLMEYVEGDNYEGRPDELSAPARERLLCDAGRNIARLHDCGPVSGVGRMGYVDGGLQVIDPEWRSASAADVRDFLLESAEDTLETLETGGYFPDLAEKPERFADLISPLKTYLREALPELPEPDTPTYHNGDYRYGNLLVDPTTGETRAVVDWGLLSAHDPAHNVAYTECALISPEMDGQDRAQELRTVFRDAYTDTREHWVFDEQRRERIRVYRLLYRLDAMACLPLWLKNAPPKRRDEREQDHRDFVSQYL